MTFRKGPAGSLTAAAAFAIALAGCAPQQQAAAPQQTAAVQSTAPQSAAEMPLARIEVREAQTLLGRLGYGPSSVDGIVGPSSRAAAAAYRADMGAPGAGAFDRDLLNLLRQSAKASGVSTVAAPPPAPQRTARSKPAAS